MNNVYVIRHPKADIASGICYGQLDVGIEAGWQDDLSLILDHPVFQSGSKSVVDIRLISSPLKRCLQLTEALATKATNIKFETDARLMELDFGDWEGIAWDEINAEDLDHWSHDYQNVTVPNGESWQDLKTRCETFLADVSKSPSMTIIVTHAGVIRTLKYLRNGTDLNELFGQPVPYATLIEL